MSPGWRRALLALAAVLGVGAMAAGLGRLRVDTSPGSLLPTGDRAVAAWEETQASFGGDPVVVLFEGDLLGPEAVGRLVALEGELARLPDVAVVYGPGTTLNQIAIQLTDLLVTITARRDGLRADAEAAARAAGASEAKAKAAGEAAVAGFEARYGSLVAAGLPLGLPSLRNPAFAREVFLDAEGRARAPMRWIVPDDSHVAVYVRPREGLDQAATDRLVRAVRTGARRAGIGTGVTVTGAPVVAVSLGAEVRRELSRLGLVALLAVAAAFFLTHRARGWRRLAPLLVGLAATGLTLAGFGLAGVPVSLGMLVFLPVMLGVGTDLPIQAAYPSSTRTLGAAAAASAAGFAALALSPLPFVRHLGLALAAGVLLSTALAVLIRRPNLTAAPPQPEGPPTPGVLFRRNPRERNARWRRLAVGGAAALLAGAGWAVLPSLPVEARPDRLAEGLPALGEARTAERVLGASGEVSVRVRADDVLRPDLLVWFGEAEERLVVRFGDRLRPVVSPGRLLSWLGPDPTATQVDAALRVLPSYLTGASIRSDRREAVATYGLRLGDLGSQAALLSQAEKALPPAPAGAEVELTGLPVVATRAYERLSGGRLAASLAGPAMAGIVLLALLRQRRHAVAAVAGAVLAIGWGLLALRVAGLGLSPLTVGLGSLTAAVGAEFTVFALERRAAGSAAPWPGVLAAALTSVAGFAILSLSRLEVLREFGLVLAGSVLLALLAARLVVGRARPLHGQPGGDATSLPPRADARPVPLGVPPR